MWCGVMLNASIRSRLLATVAGTVPKVESTRLIVEARKKNIPQSQWKMNFLVKLVRGKWLPDALAQLNFSPKRRAVEVSNVVKVNLDNISHISYFGAF